MNVNEEMFELGNHGSAIRELFEYGRKRKQEIGPDKVFDYSLGNPSIPAPPCVNETLIQLLKEKEPTALHGYTSAAGDQSVRDAIAADLQKRYHVEVDSKLIYMTCGAAASLTATLNALVNPGDEVLVNAPFFPEYRVFTEKAGGKLVVIPACLPTFQIDFDRLEKLITPKTKALIIDSPNNPSGALLTHKSLLFLSALLQKKEEEFGHPIYLISDEPYREILYDDKEYPFVTSYYPNSIVCYSFSKSLSLPGERIGYVLVNPKCDDAITVFKAICGAGRALGFVCAPAIFQYMIPACLGKTSDISIYRENRDVLYNSLVSMGYEVVHPDGAFYLFVKALEDDAKAFSKKALDYELLLVPSDSFGIGGYVRISYCVAPDMVKRSIPAFQKLKDAYNK